VSDAASAVRWLLDQAEPEARRVAVQQIAKVRGHHAPELLIRALADDDWRVRKEGTLVAPSLEHREEVIAALVAALEETVNVGLRNAAVEALIVIGPDAVGASIDALSRVGAQARKLLVEVLGGIADARGTGALALALADDDANVRVAAAEALGTASLAGEESRERAIWALADVLSTNSPFLRIAALESLSRLAASLPWAVFEPFVSDPLLRRYAIAAASTSREPPAIRALATATGDASPTIARDALVALGDLLAAAHEDDTLVACARAAIDAAGHDLARRAAGHGEDPRARGGALLVLGLLRDSVDVPLLVGALGDDDVAERADLAVRMFGADVIAPLLELARGSQPWVHAAALTLAASFEGASVVDVRSALRDALGSTFAQVTSCAVELLGVVGDASDLGRVTPLVRDTDERIAAAAVNAVSGLAARHVKAARDLLSESISPQVPAVVRCILLGGIATTDSLRPAEVRSLERALAHDDPHVRRAAIDALAQAGSEAASDAVAFALSDEEREVKIAAVRALGSLGRVEPLIAVIADTRDPVLTAIGLRALGEADPQRAVAAARPLVRHSDPAIACAAVEAIGQLDRAERTPTPEYRADREYALFSALDHPNAEVVKLALSLVGVRPGPQGFVRLGLCLDHPSSEVRRVAAELLAQDKSPASQGLLSVRYEREKDPVVREAIALAVSIRPPAEPSRSERGNPATLVPQRFKAGK
jgi:HEAT repeat protein